MLQKSFQQLPAPTKYAYVWVDDIQSKFFGGYSPFAVHVIVGGLFPPFQAASGKLDRASFDKLSRSAYNTQRFGPLQVTDAAVRARTATLWFSSGNQKYSLRVVAVNPSRGGEDSADFQVCW